MNSGIIEIGSDFANKIGFTKDLFDGYLWRLDNNTIVISLIHSLKPQQGNVSRFIDHLLESGFTVEVPSPFPGMQSILERKGFIKETRKDPQLLQIGEFVIWRKSNKGHEADVGAAADCKPV